MDKLKVHVVLPSSSTNMGSEAVPGLACSSLPSLTCTFYGAGFATLALGSITTRLPGPSLCPPACPFWLVGEREEKEACVLSLV